jgi:hypothetical protein
VGRGRRGEVARALMEEQTAGVRTFVGLPDVAHATIATYLDEGSREGYGRYRSPASFPYRLSMNSDVVAASSVNRTLRGPYLGTVTHLVLREPKSTEVSLSRLMRALGGLKRMTVSLGDPRGLFALTRALREGLGHRVQRLHVSESFNPMTAPPAIIYLKASPEEGEEAHAELDFAGLPSLRALEIK